MKTALQEGLFTALGGFSLGVFFYLLIFFLLFFVVADCCLSPGLTCRGANERNSRLKREKNPVNWLEKSDTRLWFVRPYINAVGLLWLRFTFTDSCSARSLWTPPGKYVGIYIYIPNSTAGSWDATIPPSYRREREGRKRGKSTHRSISVWVYTLQHTWVTYIHCVSVFVRSVKKQSLNSVSSPRIWQLPPTGWKTTTDWFKLLSSSRSFVGSGSCNADRDWSWSEAVSLTANVPAPRKRKAHPTSVVSEDPPSCPVLTWPTLRILMLLFCPLLPPSYLHVFFFHPWFTFKDGLMRFF